MVNLSTQEVTLQIIQEENSRFVLTFKDEADRIGHTISATKNKIKKLHWSSSKTIIKYGSSKTIIKYGC